MKIKEISNYSLTSLIAALDQDAENEGMGSLPNPTGVSAHFITPYQGFTRQQLLDSLSDHLDGICDNTTIEEVQTGMGEDAAEHLIASERHVTDALNEEMNITA